MQQQQDAAQPLDQQQQVYTESTTVEFRGQYLSVASACYVTGLPPRLAVARLNRQAYRGDVERCLSAPVPTAQQITEAAARQQDWEERQKRRAERQEREKATGAPEQRKSPSHRGPYGRPREQFNRDR
jgi:hypothetical protein